MPNKALCEKQQVDWSRRLINIDPGIVCRTVTVDASATASSYAEIALAHGKGGFHHTMVE